MRITQYVTNSDQIGVRVGYDSEGRVHHVTVSSTRDGCDIYFTLDEWHDLHSIMEHLSERA